MRDALRGLASGDISCAGSGGNDGDCNADGNSDEHGAAAAADDGEGDCNDSGPTDAGAEADRATPQLGLSELQSASSSIVAPTVTLEADAIRSPESVTVVASIRAAPNSAAARDEPALGVRALPPRRRDREAGAG